jgi:hypothetical protein
MTSMPRVIARTLALLTLVAAPLAAQDTARVRVLTTREHQDLDSIARDKRIASRA